MAFLKNLFIGVYASNAAIRLLFLPLCYLLLSSPFLAILTRRFALDKQVLAYIPRDFKTPDTLPQVFIALVVVSFLTRALSGTDVGSVAGGKEGGGGKRRVQCAPYWVPFARHWGNVVFRGEGWLRGLRDSSLSSIVAYNAAGTKHNLILSPALLDQALKDSNNIREAAIPSWAVLRNAFNMPSSAKARYFELQPAISKTMHDEIFHGPQLETLISASLAIVSESLPDLITFNSSIVDQMAWERVAGVDLTAGTTEVECDLFALIHEFFCHAIIQPLTGMHFTESYPLLASDLATLNQSFYALALGFPRFFPLPGLPTASLAKSRLFQNFARFFDELEHPPVKTVVAVVDDDASVSGDEDADAETPTPLTALNELFSQHDTPVHVRAAITLQLVHDIISQVVPQTFWALVHIYSASPPTQPTSTSTSTSTPLSTIRAETAAWAMPSQPPSIHPSFPSPPDLTFRSCAPALSPKSFPYLRSTIAETRRLYSGSLRTLQLKAALTLTEPNPARSVSPNESWHLDAASYLDVGLSQTLINTASANYLSPSTFNPERFVHTPAPAPRLLVASTASADTYTTALLVAFIAGITQLWDISAAPKKSFMDTMYEVQAAAAGQEVNEVRQTEEKKVGVWKVPKMADAAGGKVPAGDVRVRISRREGLGPPETMRKGR
ncbi:hypothetical protein BDV95DRAFT_670450 [Massariosphaeria phaeospora]|uniref:Cytochrome P450 n=1 Tax=Massariosphaeria phaeospora TaxID=100035 RepID=A0A7C8M4M9_9PLEO|nr:hypothetical protein BDV95DRAFT_670450 [Massariosphaeria phaeospora]